MTGTISRLSGKFVYYVRKVSSRPIWAPSTAKNSPRPSASSSTAARPSDPSTPMNSSRPSAASSSAARPSDPSTPMNSAVFRQEARMMIAENSEQMKTAEIVALFDNLKTEFNPIFSATDTFLLCKSMVGPLSFCSERKTARQIAFCSLNKLLTH